MPASQFPDFKDGNPLHAHELVGIGDYARTIAAFFGLAGAPALLPWQIGAGAQDLDCASNSFEATALRHVHLRGRSGACVRLERVARTASAPVDLVLRFGQAAGDVPRLDWVAPDQFKEGDEKVGVWLDSGFHWLLPALCLASVDDLLQACRSLSSAAQAMLLVLAERSGQLGSNVALNPLADALFELSSLAGESRSAPGDLLRCIYRVRLMIRALLIQHYQQQHGESSAANAPGAVLLAVGSLPADDALRAFVEKHMNIGKLHEAKLPELSLAQLIGQVRSLSLDLSENGSLRQGISYSVKIKGPQRVTRTADTSDDLPIWEFELPEDGGDTNFLRIHEAQRFLLAVRWGRSGPFVALPSPANRMAPLAEFVLKRPAAQTFLQVRCSEAGFGLGTAYLMELR